VRLASGRREGGGIQVCFRLLQGTVLPRDMCPARALPGNPSPRRFLAGTKTGCKSCAGNWLCRPIGTASPACQRLARVDQSSRIPHAYTYTGLHTLFWHCHCTVFLGMPRQCGLRLVGGRIAGYPILQTTLWSQELRTIPVCCLCSTLNRPLLRAVGLGLGLG